MPILCSLVIGYFIGSVFMSVYSFAMDTILQCFLLDEELCEMGANRTPDNRPAEMDGFVTDLKNKKGGCCG